ncbi:MAG: ATP-binding protein [Pseudomonadota bacterium]
MVSISQLTQAELDRQFDAVRIGDDDVQDFTARLAVVLLVGIVLWRGTDQLLMLVWAIGYCVLNLWFWKVASRRTESATPNQLRIVLSGSVLISAWYAGMVVYVATLGDGDYLILAACGTVGAALHTLSTNDEFSYSALIDLTATVVAGIGVLLAAAGQMNSQWAMVATLLGGLCVIGYFCIAVRQVLGDRESLHKRHLADIQDQKMRALGQLSSGLAHDFNNLLAVVSMNIELARVTEEQAQREKHLGDAYAAAGSGAELIKQMMAYVRKSDLKKTEVDVPALMDRMLAVLPRVLPARIELGIDIAPRCNVQCDPEMLESALLNLVINARDAIGDHPGRIDISVSTNSDASLVEIRVRDSGPGMDMETLELACEPYFTTKGVGQGSGLGLSMVNGFAEQSGGRLILANCVQGGLEVSLGLPAAFSDTRS